MEKHLFALITASKQKQPTEQRQLYELCYTPIYKIVQRYISDNEKVSTIVNDSMLKVFTNLAIYETEAKFWAWLKQVTVNTCIDYVRVKANMRTVQNIEFVSEDNYSIDASIIEKIDANEIVYLLNQLPTHLSTVFNLYVYENYAHQEIANILDIPVGTCRYYFSEAKKQLKPIVENYFFSLNKNIAK